MTLSTVSQLGPIAAPSDGSRKTAGLTLGLVLVILFLVVTFMLVPALLEQVMAYRTSGGSVFEKIHPATYFAVIAYCTAFLSKDPLDNDVGTDGFLNFTIAFLFLLFLYLVLNNKFYFAATVLDVILAPAMITFAMGSFDRHKLILVGRVFIIICLLNLPVVAYEFLFKIRIYTYGIESLYFRPAGLFQHPVIAGPLCYCAMLLVISGTIPFRYQLPILLALLTEILFLAVRAPLLVGILIFCAYLFSASKQKYGIFIVIGTLVVIPFVVYGLADSELTQRVMERGIWDNSSNARITIYDAIHYLTDDEFVSGIDAARADYYVQSTGNKFNESFFVIALFQGGILFAIAYTAALIIFFMKWMRSNILYAVCVVMVAAASNALATKGPTVAALTLTGYLVYQLKKPIQFKGSNK